MKGDREKCLDSGMDDYVSKPIRRQKLLNALQPLVSKSGPSLRDESEQTHDMASSDDATSLALIDWKEALSTVDNDEEILLAVVEAGLEELPQLVTALSEAVKTEDARAAQRCAHTIKSTAGTFGATALHECAQAVESNAEAGQLDSVSDLQPEMERLCERFLSELKQHKASSGS